MSTPWRSQRKWTIGSAGKKRRRKPCMVGEKDYDWQCVNDRCAKADRCSHHQRRCERKLYFVNAKYCITGTQPKVYRKDILDAPIDTAVKQNHRIPHALPRRKSKHKVSIMFVSKLAGTRQHKEAHNQQSPEYLHRVWILKLQSTVAEYPFLVYE